MPASTSVLTSALAFALTLVLMPGSGAEALSGILVAGMIEPSAIDSHTLPLPVSAQEPALGGLASLEEDEVPLLGA